MPVTEIEHEQRIQRQREYRETSPLPEDERIALPQPSNLPRPRKVAQFESICDCGACCLSTAVLIRCGCGCIHERAWR
jgi:hypothetical protein